MEKKIGIWFVLLGILLGGLIKPVAAADQPVPAPIDAKQQQAIIDEISKTLIENYVYLETANKMSDRIKGQMKSGAYAKLTNPDDFADQVNVDLQALSKDKHLAFHFAPDRAGEVRKLQSQNEEEKKAASEKALEAEQKDNFGFRKIERLPGNIGYLDFRYFADAAEGGETAIAAMNMLSNSDAIIIDLRQNGGGDPTQIQLISSYFFADPTHLNDLYNRKEDTTKHYWTYRYVPGKRMDKVDLYILTSAYTFSGAEEFCYNMKNLKRATIIGETTGGGAHPTDSFLVQTDYLLRVPTERAINPISKTNWEGTGVTPDIAVPQKDALDKAYSMALEKLASAAKTPEDKVEVEWALAGVKAKLNPIQVDEPTMQLYAGTYEDRKVTFENGALYYQRVGPKYKLIPMTQTLFGLDSDLEFRLEFVVENGKAVKVIGHYIGDSDESKRTN